MHNQHLIRKLESGDVEARREAARTLAQYPAMQDIMERDERDISDAIDPLAVVFFDEDAEVRKRVRSDLRKLDKWYNAAMQHIAERELNARGAQAEDRIVYFCIRGNLPTTRQIAVFLPEQEDDRAAFTQAGWQTFSLDQIETILELLMA